MFKNFWIDCLPMYFYKNLKALSKNVKNASKISTCLFSDSLIWYILKKDLLSKIFKIPNGKKSWVTHYFFGTKSNLTKKKNIYKYLDIAEKKFCLHKT